MIPSNVLSPLKLKPYGRRVLQGAMALLAVLWTPEPGADLDLDSLVPHLEAVAAAGDIEAQTTLATLQLERRVAGDTEAARLNLVKAAEAGNAAAASTLGNFYYEGRFLPLDQTAAHRWWRTAAELGNADAQYNLGIVLLRRSSGKADVLAWLEHAAEQNHTLACFTSGTWYAEHGDAERAVTHLKCAGANGYAPAQFNLGKLYLRIDRNDIARQWFEAAAITFTPAAQALASLPASPPSPPPPPPPPPLPPPARAIHGVEWVKAQPDTNFTLQVAAGRSSNALEYTLQRHVRGNESAYFLHRPNASEPFSAIVGSYTDYAAAERDLVKLPDALLANAPWVRRFGVLHRELRRHANQDPGARRR